MKENYTRFIKIGCNKFLSCKEEYFDVPTKEEYDDYRERVNNYLEELESRIKALEEERNILQTKESSEKKDSDTCKASICSIAEGEIELFGTIAQHRIFEKSREEIDKSLFPRFLTREKLVLLAVDCGLSVRKIERDDEALR